METNMTLLEFLQEQNKTNTNFTLPQLNKLFPKDKETIKRYKFLGLIEPVSNIQTSLLRSKVVANESETEQPASTN